MAISIPNHPVRKLSLNRTIIMGILNVTPDSFSDGGKFYGVNEAVRQGLRMIADGADIIDIGGESTRPGARPLSLNDELKRVIPVIKIIARKAPKTLISIDTYKAPVAEAAIKAGARIINDISGLGFDKDMAAVAAKYKTPVIIMHIKGTPGNMQDNPVYRNLMRELIRYFRQRIRLAIATGIKKSQIIIDPGIGFGKRLDDNYAILKRLNELRRLDQPLMVGPSRKSFIGKVLDLPADERLEGTAAAVAISILNGADIVRVHDVKEMKRVARICDYLKQI
ncbi:MAG: dihydropteroate synthase [Planctomycetes bacterium]|nr:dihydropteroate synthase [Planctomycetota bacterium]